jgi:hypothetical protein
MNDPSEKRSDRRFPADMLALLGTMVIFGITALFGGFLLPPLSRVSRGDPTLLYVALVLACVGIVLLFMARLPLYRQRRFFTFGPGALVRSHRCIYQWAYVFISCGAFLLVLLHLLIR